MLPDKHHCVVKGTTSCRVRVVNLVQCCRERVNIPAWENGFLRVVSRLGSQTSVSVQSLQITVCECSELHTKGTSLPEAGINRGFSNSNYNRQAATSSGMPVWLCGNLGEGFTLTLAELGRGGTRRGGIFMAIYCVKLNMVRRGRQLLPLPSRNVG